MLERPAGSTNTPLIYDLVANVTHESTAGTTRDKESTVWKVHARAGRGEREQWLQIQDTIVEEIRKEMIFLGETVMQVGIDTALQRGFTQRISSRVDMGVEPKSWRHCKGQGKGIGDGGWGLLRSYWGIASSLTLV